MIVAFMLAGIVTGFVTGSLSLFAGAGFLGALGIYALTGFAVMAAGMVLAALCPRTRQDPLVFGT